MVTNSLDVYYPLTACQCGKDDKCVDHDPTSPAFSGEMLNQGDELKVCVQFDSSDPPFEDSVGFSDVKTFMCTKDLLTYRPISDYEYTLQDGLTSG